MLRRDEVNKTRITWSTCLRAFSSLCLSLDDISSMCLSFFAFSTSKARLCAMDSSNFFFILLHSWLASLKTERKGKEEIGAARERDRKKMW